MQRNIYREALAVQDASNLSGVLHSWHALLPKIWEEVRANGGDFNHHPVNVLFGSKVNSLTGYEHLFSEAYGVAEQKAKE